METDKMKTRFKRLVTDLEKEFKGVLVLGEYAPYDVNSNRKSEICIEKETFDSRYFKQFYKDKVNKYGLGELDIKIKGFKRQTVKI